MANARLVYVTPTGLWKAKRFDSVATARKYGKKVKKQNGYYVCGIESYHNKKNHTLVKTHKV